MKDIELIQKTVCEEFLSIYVPSPPALKVGISLNVRDNLSIINGLRHLPEGDSSGWFIWAGENYSTNDDFFVPLHIEHLCEWSPQVLKFLGLAPGWRFLISEGYQDVWFDQALLCP